MKKQHVQIDRKILAKWHAVKVARTVLKGESGGNAADLLNQNYGNQEKSKRIQAGRA